MTAEVASISAGTRSLRGAPASSSMKLPRHCRRAAASPACMRWTRQWRLRGSSWHMRRTMQSSSTLKTQPLCHPHLFRWRRHPSYSSAAASCCLRKQREDCIGTRRWCSWLRMMCKRQGMLALSGADPSITGSDTAPGQLVISLLSFLPGGLATHLDAIVWDAPVCCPLLQFNRAA